MLRPGRPVETAIFPGDEDALTRHWVGERDGSVVACVTVMQQPWQGRAWRLRGMAVDVSLQRSGLGRRLLLQVHSEVAEPMWCDARLVAVPFYAAGGWSVASMRYEIEGIGPHHKMTWDPGP